MMGVYCDNNTNHSLRTTTASRLYTLGVDEQLIMKRTGHSTVAGICSYKQIMIEQKERVSDIMCSKKQRVDCEADKENRDMEPVTGKEFAVPVQVHSALMSIQVSIQVSSPVPMVTTPTVTLPEPTCSSPTLTHPKPTSGATPGGFIF